MRHGQQLMQGRQAVGLSGGSTAPATACSSARRTTGPCRQPLLPLLALRLARQRKRPRR